MLNSCLLVLNLKDGTLVYAFLPGKTYNRKWEKKEINLSPHHWRWLDKGWQYHPKQSSLGLWGLLSYIIGGPRWFRPAHQETSKGGGKGEGKRGFSKPSLFHGAKIWTKPLFQNETRASIPLYMYFILFFHWNWKELPTSLLTLIKKMSKK